MSETKIEWTATVMPDGRTLPGYTLNPWLGCTEVSEGCDSCYAKNTVENRRHWAKWGKGEPRRRTQYWNVAPFKWDAEAKASGIRRKVFCGSLCDWADEEVDEKWRVELWADVILKCRNLDWLMVTKRIQKAKRFMKWLRGAFPLQWPGQYNAKDDTPLPHVWMIATTENQERFDQRYRALLEIPAVVHGISYEPALGPLDFRAGMTCTCTCTAERGHCDVCLSGGINWVIVGGESDQEKPARPFDIAWARSTVRQCKAAEVACFVKQLGARPFEDDSAILGAPLDRAHIGRLPGAAMKDRKGGDMSEWPEDLRVREFPQVPA